MVNPFWQLVWIWHQLKGQLLGMSVGDYFDQGRLTLSVVPQIKRGGRRNLWLLPTWQVHPFYWCHCCCWIPSLLSEPNCLRLLGWTEDQQPPRNPSNFQHRIGTPKTSALFPKQLPDSQPVPGEITIAVLSRPCHARQPSKPGVCVHTHIMNIYIHSSVSLVDPANTGLKLSSKIQI